MKVAKLIRCKNKFNPFTKSLMMNSGGFPDFIAFQKTSERGYNVIGVECKTNGYLDKEEKEKCQWLLENGLFNEIWVAKKKEEEIEYVNFKDKYLKDSLKPEKE